MTGPNPEEGLDDDVIEGLLGDGEYELADAVMGITYAEEIELVLEDPDSDEAES